MANVNIPLCTYYRLLGLFLRDGCVQNFVLSRWTIIFYELDRRTLCSVFFHMAALLRSRECVTVRHIGPSGRAVSAFNCCAISPV